MIGGLLFCAEKSGAAQSLQPVIVTVSPRVAHVTAHEPIILDLAIENNAKDSAHVSLGRDRKEGLTIEIRSPSRDKTRLVWPRRSGFSRVGDFEIAPAGQYLQSYILDEAYNFAEVGQYEVEATLANPILIHGVPTATPNSFHARIEIEPRNEAALEKRCEFIVTQIEQASSFQDAADAALALSYVRDPVAVPFLQKLLTTNWRVQPSAIVGLERIASRDAINVLALAAKEQGDTSTLAKSALERIESQTPDPQIKNEIRRIIRDTERPRA
jgi:hypothetical protein